ncbi:MAG TPA: prepilin-type N-terminal cleavage/methylation domain-containing protein [bacterium]|nr:prepilin-type N-terminal cleavage/methylation domain-containing protein [bacterium]
MKNNKKGFTLIELLVVIAIIGLLATLSVVALNNARMKSRDAKRVSDIKQVQTALELYFVDQNSYPTGSATVLGSTGADTLSSTSGFASAAAGTTYMGQVPAEPTPAAVPAGYVYSALPASCTGTACTGYNLVFGLEGATGGLTSGAHTANANGIQ